MKMKMVRHANGELVPPSWWMRIQCLIIKAQSRARGRVLNDTHANEYLAPFDRNGSPHRSKTREDLSYAGRAPRSGHLVDDL